MNAPPSGRRGDIAHAHQDGDRRELKEVKSQNGCG